MDKGEDKADASDSGLWGLLLLSKYHKLEASGEALRHEFGVTGEAFGERELVLAARKVGFKARVARLSWDRLDRAVLPCLCRRRDGGWCVFGAYGKRAGSDVFEGLLQYPDGRLEKLERAGLEAELDGGVIQLASRASLSGELSRFDFTWFIPAMVKHRKLLGDVLLLSFFLQLFGLLTPIFFQVVMDKVLVHRGFTTLNVVAFGFFAVVVFETVMGFLRTYLFTHTTTRIDSELGSKLFRHLLSLPQSYFEGRRVGDSVARVRELDTIREFLTSSALTVLLDVLFLVVFLCAMWFYSGILTLIVLLSFPCYGLLSFFLTPVLRRRVQEKFVLSAESQGLLVESVSGMSTLKSQAAEPRMCERWDRRLAAQVKAGFEVSKLSNFGTNGVQLISKLTTVGILWFGAHEVISGEMTVGALIAFNMLSSRVSQPVIRLAQLWQDFQQAGVSVKRLGDILNAPTERVPTSGGGDRGRLNGRIDFEGVSFSYPLGQKEALSGVDLVVPAHGRLGIVGASGSGKSTLVKLVQKVHKATRGRVLVDEVDLSVTDPSWLRRQIGVVEQDSRLFRGTVKENVSFSDPSMGMDRVMDACRLAGAHDFVTDLAQGYDTDLDEGGANLSGGQRQRLALARALARDPRMLILDEATSALDYESERAILGNMDSICRNRTVLIVSHRLSAVRDCDEIVVMSGGGIIERGTHASLLADKGAYARLHELQTG